MKHAGKEKFKKFCSYLCAACTEDLRLDRHLIITDPSVAGHRESHLLSRWRSCRDWLTKASSTSPLPSHRDSRKKSVRLKNGTQNLLVTVSQVLQIAAEKVIMQNCKLSFQCKLLFISNT